MRRMFGAALAAAIVSLGAPAVAADPPASPAAARAAENLKVFDAAWLRVQRSYYDRGFNGVDWRAARVEFRPMAQAAVDERTLYDVIDAMLGRLRDDHAFVTSPSDLDGGAANPPPGVQAASDAGLERRWAELREGVWVVGFDEFVPGVADWMSVQLARAPDAPLVVDLRGNRGGDIYELRQTLACLAPPGWVIAQFKPRRGHAWSERAPACAEPRRGPVVVLVDRDSRSSAELFAAAVQETGRGVVVGEHTGAAVLASLLYPLPDGGEISVSIGDAHTGAGVRLEGFGVRPDVQAATTAADWRAGRDPALAKAVEVALRG